MNLRTAICVFKFLRNRILECCNCDLLIIPFTFKRRVNQLTAYLSSLPLSFLLRFFPFRDTFFLFNFHFWCQRTWDLKKAMESEWLLSSRKKILGSLKHGTVPRANNLQEPSKTYGINSVREVTQSFGPIPQIDGFRSIFHFIVAIVIAMNLLI